MSRFLTRLAMECTSDQDECLWQLTKPLVYVSDVAKATIIVPAGFVTDLASVPRLPLVYLLTGNTSNEASVVHDYLYTVRSTARSTADAVLRQASAVTGVPAWRRWLMYIGVRLGGGLHWG